MTKHNWKPGDVAIVRNQYGVWNVAIRVVGLVADEWQYGVARTTAPLDADARPLVVIDPEDREQVKRLGDAFCLARWDHTPDSNECDPLTFSSMQAALREFANPTPPKPDEPTGLGAVVEDADGRRWVRDDEGPDEPRSWYRRGYDACRTYDEIAAVRVLSTGVTA